MSCFLWPTIGSFSFSSDEDSIIVLSIHLSYEPRQSIRIRMLSDSKSEIEI